MKRFDPSSFLPLKPRLSVMPQHGEAWSGKLANWWAGTTIAAPTSEAAAPASECVKNIRRLVSEGVEPLNDYYVGQTQWARQWVRTILGLPESQPVLLDASGTASILLVTRMLAHVAYAQGAQSFFTITTDEGGSLVPATLRGYDPNEIVGTMFQPNTGLFYESMPALPYPPMQGLPSQMVHLSKLDNGQLVTELKRVVLDLYALGHRHGVLVLPHVVKSGRLLPARQVAALVEEFKGKGLNLYFVLDDVQGFCRTDAESIANPLAWCDAYILGSSKALGGLMIASASAVRSELVERFVALAESRKLTPEVKCVAHFQFEPQWEARLPDALMKRGAVSLPEVVAMSAAMYWHYFRGAGQTYAQRRCHQIELVWGLRARVVAALKQVEGVEILENTAERPIVPSIVSFKVDTKVSPAALKQALQQGTPAITTGAPIGRYLRLDIPEYREMPSPELLAKRLSALVQKANT
ncbi:MAG TPA: hypothetical protein V6C81_18375 [Planktothrix sp.]|jgi:hypothetical protein